MMKTLIKNYIRLQLWNLIFNLLVSKKTLGANAATLRKLEKYSIITYILKLLKSELMQKRGAKKKL